MTRGIFVTGTGTDTGKTFVTALIIKRLRESGINAGYYKAALSGAEKRGDALVPGDAAYVCGISGIQDAPCGLVSYIYETPVSPHLAAKIEKNQIDMERISSDFEKLSQRFDCIVAEGSGGIICPLRRDGRTIMLTDVIKRLGLSVLIVSPSSLGAINSAVLTAGHIRAQGIAAKGFILNCYEEGNFLHEDNKREIEALSGLPVLTCVPKNAAGLAMEPDALLKFMEV